MTAAGEKPAQRRIKCEKCGREAPHLGGRQKTCILCRPQKTRERDLRRLEARDPASGAEVRAFLAAGRPTGGNSQAELEAIDAAIAALAPRLLAVGLGLDKRPDRAAALVGLYNFAQDKKKFRAALKEAREKYLGLSELRTDAIGELGTAAMAVALCRSIALSTQLSPGQVGAATRALAQTLELFQGTAKPVFSEWTVKISGPGSGDEKPGEK